MAPITASQFGTSRALEQAIVRRTGADITGAGRFAAAAAAGGVSALIGSPTELIIIQQQKNLTPLAVEARRFFATHPAQSVYRGLAPCIGRETLYAAGYLGLCPVLYDALQSKVGMMWVWIVSLGRCARALVFRLMFCSDCKNTHHNRSLETTQTTPNNNRATRPARRCSRRASSAACLRRPRRTPLTRSRRACRLVCGGCVLALRSKNTHSSMNRPPSFTSPE
jgi:hypothetical protein